jgi:hypothetical protein
MQNIMNALWKLSSALVLLLLDSARSIFSGIRIIITENPRASGVLASVLIFLYCLWYVPGFGDGAAEVITLLIVWSVIGNPFSSSKKKKGK